MARRGTYLYYVPPYSPVLNRIEPVFRQVKYQEIPVQGYTSKPAVGQGFNPYARKLGQKKSGKQLRPAA